MAGTQAFAGIAMKVLGKSIRRRKEGEEAGLVGLDQLREGDGAEVGERESKGIAQAAVEAVEGVEEEVVGRKPDGAAPIRIAPFDLLLCLARLVAEREVVKVDRMRFVVLGEAP